MKLDEIYDANGEDIEVWVCEICGRRHHVQSGGDICCCPCEFDYVPTEEG